MNNKLISILLLLSLCFGSKKQEFGLGNVTNNISGFYGLWTSHVGEGSSNNENYSKVAMYDRWIFGHSINSSRNHSFLIGRCLALKQLYFTQKIFSEFKFSVAVASGYRDYGNIPGPTGFMYGMTGAFGIGFRVKSDLESLLEVLYLPTPAGGVFSLGFSFRKVLSES